MQMFRAISYKQGSTRRTAKRLSRLLGIPLTTRTDLPNVICWGGNGISGLNCNVNSNKRLALIKLRDAGIRVPCFETTKEKAYKLLDYFGTIVGRPDFHKAGSGFNLHTTASSLDNDYTSSHWLHYIPIYKEYRVHVFKGKILGISRKTSEGVESRILNKYCRNHSNGWKFIRCDIEQMNSTLKKLAIDAVSTLGMDFGAVDIILSERRKYYVLEVNSAPSLEEGSTIIQSYVEAFYDS